jgi:hypothetical protein
MCRANGRLFIMVSLGFCNTLQEPFKSLSSSTSPVGIERRAILLSSNSFWRMSFSFSRSAICLRISLSSWTMTGLRFWYCFSRAAWAGVRLLADDFYQRLEIIGNGTAILHDVLRQLFSLEEWFDSLRCENAQLNSDFWNVQGKLLA